MAQLPGKPAVYALCGGKGARAYVAYVGIAGNLRRRVRQHLVNRDSSVTTGVTAVSLNPDLVTEVRWWEHRLFRKAQGRAAAELIAFEVLAPVMRSRGGKKMVGEDLSKESDFGGEMRTLFTGRPSGVLTLPTLTDAIARIEELEERVQRIEEAMR